MTKANLAVVARSAAVSESPEVAHRGRPRVAGKFFFHNGEKLFVRGVTYGPFAAGSHGALFPEREQVERDFAADAARSAPTACAPSRPRRAGCSTGPLGQGCGCSSASRGPSTSVSSIAARRWTPTGGGARRACATVAGHPALSRLPDRQRDPARHRALVRPRARARLPAHARRRGREDRSRARWSATRTSRRPSTSDCRLRRLRLLQRLPAPREPTSAATWRACRTSRTTSRSC